MRKMSWLKYLICLSVILVLGFIACPRISLAETTNDVATEEAPEVGTEGDYEDVDTEGDYEDVDTEDDYDYLEEGDMEENADLIGMEDEEETEDPGENVGVAVNIESKSFTVPSSIIFIAVMVLIPIATFIIKRIIDNSYNKEPKNKEE